MKKGFTYVAVIGVGVLLTLALVAQFFLDDSREDSSDAVVETTSREVATTTRAVADEIAIDQPTEIAMETAEPTPECVVIEDFAGGSAKLPWFAVNDGVMGGLSQGSVSLQQEVLVHAGVLNTNGGGFSYAGARLPANILVGYNRLQVRLNTFGRQYAVNFGDARNRRISHQTRIPGSPSDSWQEVLIDFDQTVPTIFSRRVNSASFSASAIEELNFILADGINGPFRMEIDWIKACI